MESKIYSFFLINNLLVFLHYFHSVDQIVKIIYLTNKIIFLNPDLVMPRGYANLHIIIRYFLVLKFKQIYFKHDDAIFLNPVNCKVAKQIFEITSQLFCFSCIFLQKPIHREINSLDDNNYLVIL